MEPSSDFPTTTTTNRGFRNLPQEIVDLVVDYVAESTQGRESGLRACNATSRFLHTRAEQHLFETIYLVVDCVYQTSQRAENLRQILEAKPALVGLIRSLKIIICDPNSLIRLLRPPKMGRIPSWLRKIVSIKEHFIWLLQTISYIQIENFFLGGVEGVYLDWASLSEYSQFLLLLIRSSTRLKRLELENILNLTNRMVVGGQEGPVQGPVDSIQVQHLVVRRCQINTSDTVIFDIPSIRLPFRHLETLDIADSLDDINFLVDLQSTLDIHSSKPIKRTFQFPSLKKLCISLTGVGGEVDYAEELIKSCRKTVAYLKLRIRASYITGTPVTFTLPHNPNLRVLSLSLDARSASNLQAYLKLISRMLRSPKAPTAIETIALDFTVKLGSRREVYAVFGWEDLDKALVDDAFPKLRKVIIILSLPQYSHDKWSKIMDPENILPSTTSSGRISIEVRNMVRDPFD